MDLYPLYNKAKELLFQEYTDNIKIVQDDRYYSLLVNEKLKHSLQVSGAGNGILANETYFKDRSDAYTDVVKSAILLHDIYRFREARILFQTGEKIDHGVKGAEFLEGFSDFNNILITLPIKHHGHMIEKLYEDETYQKLDTETKDQVKHICFAVRDADKIANWNLIHHDWDKLSELFIKEAEDFSSNQSKINDIVWQSFKRAEVCPNDLIQTNAERILSFICWLFDMNYAYSIKYCKKLNLFYAWNTLLQKFDVDPLKIEAIDKIMKIFVAQKFHIEI